MCFISLDSGSNLQQYLLNRSVLTSDYDAEQRHGMTAEQETFVGEFDFVIVFVSELLVRFINNGFDSR